MAAATKGSIALVSLGCAKNAVDLQVAAGNLVKAGYVLAKDQSRADTVIVNTCAFIESARQEAEREIRRALEMKRAGRYGWSVRPISLPSTKIRAERRKPPHAKRWRPPPVSEKRRR